MVVVPIQRPWTQHKNAKAKILMVMPTRVYDEPFISVFVWLENVNSPCNVIHSDDWPKIEKDLAK